MLIIYKLQHKESENCYIGSTKNLNLRMRRHKENLKAKDKCHFKLYQFINENGGWDNFDYHIMASIDDINLINVSCNAKTVIPKQISVIAFRLFLLCSIK